MALPINKTLLKLKKYETNPEMFAELTSTELASLVVHVMGAVKQIEGAIKEGRLDGYTPQAGKDYESRDTILKAFQEYTNKTSREIDEKTDITVAGLNQAVQEAIANIRDGENGIVSDEEIERAAEIASALIDLPDFDELIESAIKSSGESIVDAINLLPDGDGIDSSKVKGLLDLIDQIRREIARIPVGQGGTIGKGQVYGFIRQAIADGTISTGGSGGHIIEDEGTPLTQRTKLNFVGAGVAVTDDSGDDATVVTISGSFTNNTYQYSSLAAPQLFNPDATAVANDTDDFTLASAFSVALVTINGQAIDDSEYSLVGTTLTVTPDNGFNNTDDEVLVYQHTFSTTGTGGVTFGYVAKSATYTITSGDYVVECTANTFTTTLPSAIGIAGQHFVIKNSGNGIITLEGEGSETIDGDLNQALNQYDSVTVVSNGTNYIII